jgi:transposase
MKKNNTRPQSSRRKPSPITIGMDLGDKSSHYCALEENGEVRRTGTVATTKAGMLQVFGRMKRGRIAIEVGTHSPWVSRLLKGLGYEVIVANARRVRLITDSSRKNDKLDARTLARLARVDPGLLHPVRHRSEQGQEHLTAIRARADLVEARTQLVNAARGLVKPFGERLGKCDADQLRVGSLEGLPAGLQQNLQPLLEAIEALTEQIGVYNERIEQIAGQQYPETAVLKQVSGVGTLIALTFILTLEDARRFQKSRDVGCYLGLRPKQSQSGESQPQLPISKEGDLYLRQLMVQAAQHILSRRGPDTDLKRWGLKRCERGGKNAKKKAIVAVARKLAVLLHHLWVSGEVYEPLHNSQLAKSATAA